jgi:tetratricopeptide (TPR) repeat protein/transcriptional regulator with XRE-family HTH domain
MPVKKNSDVSPNFQLRRARQQHGWSQQELADLIGAAHTFMISRWEMGTAIPGPKYRKKLCDLFKKDPGELGFSKQPSQTDLLLAQGPLSDPTIPFRLANGHTLIGRDQLLLDLSHQLCGQDARQLIALHGLPGVGKTTLAMELATIPRVKEYFHDGILWAGLGPDANVLALLSRWGALFKLTSDEVKSLRSSHEWADMLRSTIGQRKMLLILDDTWSIEDALHCQVGGPFCSYLLTTRIPEVAIRFAGTFTVQVPELNLEDGIKLITQIVPNLSEMVPDAPQKLVQSVGGLPLALTLMGNHLLLQTRHLQLRRIQATLEKLQQPEERLILESPQAGIVHDTHIHQQTPFNLQTIIRMSEERLSIVAQQALSDLAIFTPKPNTFSEEAALAVAGVNVEVLDQLVDFGLVEINSQGRYQIHQVIVDYQRAHTDNKQAAERLCKYTMNFVELHQDEYAFLELELTNITTALNISHERNYHTLLIRGVIACGSFLFDRGMHPVSNTLHKHALASTEAIDDKKSNILLLKNLIPVLRTLGEYEQAETVALESLSLIHSQGSLPEIQCDVLAFLGHISILKGKHQAAQAYLNEGLLLAQQHQLQQSLCRLYGTLGVLLEQQGNLPQAEFYWKEGLAIARELSNPKPLSYLLGIIGAALPDYERYDEAEDYLQQGFLLARQIGSRPEICHFLLDLGELALKRQENDLASSCLRQSLSLARAMQLHPALSAILLKLGELARKNHDEESAADYLQEGLEFALQKENPYFISNIYSEQGKLYLQLEDLEHAHLAFQQALTRSPEEMLAPRAEAYYGLARVCLLRGERANAREQGEKSASLFERARAPQATEVRHWLDNAFTQ